MIEFLVERSTFSLEVRNPETKRKSSAYPTAYIVCSGSSH